MTDHDPGYKRLFSHPEMIRDLLIGFVREDWISRLDFATLEKYPTEFIDDRLRQRRNDVVWRLRWGPDWLLSTSCSNSSPASIPSWPPGCPPTSICSTRI